MLQTAQLRAAEAERFIRTHPRSSHYIVKSERVPRDIQAQWFYTLPDFFKQKAKEVKQKAKIEALFRL